MLFAYTMMSNHNNGPKNNMHFTQSLDSQIISALSQPVNTHSNHPNTLSQLHVDHTVDPLSLLLDLDEVNLNQDEYHFSHTPDFLELAPVKTPVEKHGQQHSKEVKVNSKHAVIEEKKKRKLEKNRESSRECRRRRLLKQQILEVKLKQLEEENHNLKSELKFLRDEKNLTTSQNTKSGTSWSDANVILDKLEEMLANPETSEQDLKTTVDLYKRTYADYGPARTSAVKYHIERVRSLLLPTHVTRIFLYTIGQGKRIVKKSEEDEEASEADLWKILSKELEATEEQQESILKKKARIDALEAHLRHSLEVLDKFERVTEAKNEELDRQIGIIQGLFTPRQTAKFIIWVRRNPALIYLLNQLQKAKNDST